MDKLRVAIAGLGTISERHRCAVNACPLMELTTICTRSEDNLKKRASQWGVNKTYSNYQTMLNDCDIDAIVLTTPNHLHAEMTVEALQSGKHVLCEKPPAITADDAKNMMETAQKTGKLLMYGMMFRFSPKHRVFAELRESGVFGEIYYAKGGIVRRCGSPGGWFAEKKLSGGGPLMDLGPHIIDLAVYVMGSPKAESVFARTFSKTENLDNIKFQDGYKAIDSNPRTCNIEELAVVMVNFENGACLSVETSFCSHIKEDSMYLNLLGSKAGAEIDPQFSISTAQNGYLMDITPRLTGADFDYQQAINDEVAHFADCILNGKECIPNAQVGYELMKIIDGAYRSADSGEIIKL